MLRVFRDEPVEFATILTSEECADRIRRIIARPDASPAAITGRVGRSRVVLRSGTRRRRSFGNAFPTIFTGRIVTGPAGTVLAGSFTLGRVVKFGLSVWFVIAAFLLLNGSLSALGSRATAARVLWTFVPAAVIFAIAAVDVVLSAARRQADIDAIARAVSAALKR